MALNYKKKNTSYYSEFRILLSVSVPHLRKGADAMLGVPKQLLSGILPYQQGSAHVHVKRADDALLRNLHTHIQLLDQICWNPFTFISDEKRENR